MSETLILPVVPMRNTVLLPGVSFPIAAGRPATLRAIQAALKDGNDGERRVFAVAQREDAESVNPQRLYTVGTIAKIGSVQQGLGGVRLILEGVERGIAARYLAKEGYLEATVQPAREMSPLDPKDPAFMALHREARERAAELGRSWACPTKQSNRSWPRSMSPAGWPMLSAVTSTFRRSSARRSWKRSPSRIGCAASFSTYNGRSMSSRRRKTFSPRSRKSSAGASARCICASR